MPETQKEGFRGLKQRVLKLLKSSDFEHSMEEISQLPARQVINPLFSFLYNNDELVRWRAVTAFGAVTAYLADQDMESGRVIMRRLMWNLNDESGGIGWGSPEAMGETLARHEGLADEFASILLSYAREDGNYLEHEALQRGLLWGIGRLCRVRPDLVRDGVPYLIPFLESGDAEVRGLAARVMGLSGSQDARPALELLLDDEAELKLYSEYRVRVVRVHELAKEALKRLGP